MCETIGVLLLAAFVGGALAGLLFYACIPVVMLLAHLVDGIARLVRRG